MYHMRPLGAHKHVYAMVPSAFIERCVLYASLKLYPAAFAQCLCLWPLRPLGDLSCIEGVVWVEPALRPLGGLYGSCVLHPQVCERALEAAVVSLR